MILAGWDGSERGRDALALAQMIAPMLGVEAVPVAVVTSAGEGGSEGLPAEALVREGSSPARVLHDLAREKSARAIALGASHRAGVGRVFPGSVAERLLQGSPCPVAIAPTGYRERVVAEPRVIAVAYDASPEARDALALASELARAAQAALRIVTVYSGPPAGDSSLSTAPSGRQRLQEALHETTANLPSELRAQPKFLTGVAASTLIAESELGVDLLVMGSRGHGPIHTALVGGTSQAVIRQAACPVLITSRGARAGTSS